MQHQRSVNNADFIAKGTPPALDPTISYWKTFTNTAYKYTLQYPPDYNLRSRSWDGPGKDLTTSKTVDFTYGFSEPERFYSVIVEAGRGSSVDANQFSQWVRNDVDRTIRKNNAMMPNLAKLGLFIETSVDNRPAIYVEFLSGRTQGKTGYAIYILNKQNTVFGIATTESSASQTEEEAKFEKIVSIFHFTTE